MYICIMTTNNSETKKADTIRYYTCVCVFTTGIRFFYIFLKYACMCVCLSSVCQLFCGSRTCNCIQLGSVSIKNIDEWLMTFVFLPR